MITKSRLYLVGLLTLLMAPLGWVVAGFPSIHEFIALNDLNNNWVILGIEFGAVAAFVLMGITALDTKAPLAKRQTKLISTLQLTTLDCVFLALCAGIGEEFLFRQGMQVWVHPIITSIFFVAIHGYFSLKDWNITKYGILVLLFIIGVSYLRYYHGIWSAIGAHAMYDFVLFYFWKNQITED